MMSELIKNLCLNLVTDMTMKNTILASLVKIQNQNKNKEKNCNKELKNSTQTETPTQDKNIEVENNKVTTQSPANGKLIKVRKSPCLISD